jgi:predicted ATP-dependent endonuclease of OLD family
LPERRERSGSSRPRNLRSQNGSLLLFDEPETSLRPKAQAEVRSFLLNMCKERKHQILICSHSPEMVKGLPKDAIKVFTPIPERKFRVIQNVKPSEAFFFLGSAITLKSIIFVEDTLAASF